MYVVRIAGMFPSCQLAFFLNFLYYYIQQEIRALACYPGFIDIHEL